MPAGGARAPASPAPPGHDRPSAHEGRAPCHPARRPRRRGERVDEPQGLMPRQRAEAGLAPARGRAPPPPPPRRPRRGRAEPVRLDRGPARPPSPPLGIGPPLASRDGAHASPDASTERGQDQFPGPARPSIHGPVRSSGRRSAIAAARSAGPPRRPPAPPRPVWGEGRAAPVSRGAPSRRSPSAVLEGRQTLPSRLSGQRQGPARVQARHPSTTRTGHHSNGAPPDRGRARRASAGSASRAAVRRPRARPRSPPPKPCPEARTGLRRRSAAPRRRRQRSRPARRAASARPRPSSAWAIACLRAAARPSLSRRAARRSAPAGRPFPTFKAPPPPPPASGGRGKASPASRGSPPPEAAHALAGIRPPGARCRGSARRAGRGRERRGRSRAARRAGPRSGPRR